MKNHIVLLSFLLYLHFYLFISLSTHGSEVVKKGDEIERLTIKSGRVYEGVVIREVLPLSLRIIHKDGAANIPASELPQYAQMFSVVEEPATQITLPTEPHTNDEQVEQWTPSSVEDVMDCSLIVNITESVNEKGNAVAGAGSAFLVNHGKATYIYSNVHNFDGTRKFEIIDRHGNRYTDFVSVEAAADGYGFYNEKKWGGDILRIRLSKYRTKALTIDPEVLTAANGNGRTIVVTGNTQGRGVITRLEGIIKDVDHHGILHHTAATEGGNSGSPIVELGSFKVLGILTWGMLDTRKPMHRIWLEDNPNPSTRISTASGAGLAGVKYVACSFDKLYTQRVMLNDLKKLARLMGLMDTLVPAKEGLFLDNNAIVQGDYNVEKIFKESGNNPILHQLVDLSNFLKKRSESNVGISNKDMLKIYISSYEECLKLIRSQREKSLVTKDLTFYMKCILKNTRALDICLAYEDAIEKSIDGYDRMRGIGGGALPLANRFRLPSYSSGLSSLGIGEE
jgi:hypothetical protein